MGGEEFKLLLPHICQYKYNPNAKTEIKKYIKMRICFFFIRYLFLLTRLTRIGCKGDPFLLFGVRSVQAGRPYHAM
jgi:hypothetical protein